MGNSRALSVGVGNIDPQLALQVRTQNLPENKNNEAPAIKKALHT